MNRVKQELNRLIKEYDRLREIGHMEETNERMKELSISMEKLSIKLWNLEMVK